MMNVLGIAGRGQNAWPAMARLHTALVKRMVVAKAPPAFGFVTEAALGFLAEASLGFRAARERGRIAFFGFTESRSSGPAKHPVEACWPPSRTALSFQVSCTSTWCMSA